MDTYSSSGYTYKPPLRVIILSFEVVCIPLYCVDAIYIFPKNLRVFGVSPKKSFRVKRQAWETFSDRGGGWVWQEGVEDRVEPL